MIKLFFLIPIMFLSSCINRPGNLSEVVASGKIVSVAKDNSHSCPFVIIKLVNQESETILMDGNLESFDKAVSLIQRPVVIKARQDSGFMRGTINCSSRIDSMTLTEQKE